jgi:hypothetical protein
VLSVIKYNALVKEYEVTKGARACVCVSEREREREGELKVERL